MTFGERLKKIRYERGFSQQELAEKLQVSRSSIGNYEQGSREPDFETLEAMADILNVDMNYLLGKSDMTSVVIDERTARFLSYLEKLNDVGKEKAIENLMDLSEIKRYLK